MVVDEHSWQEDRDRFVDSNSDDALGPLAEQFVTLGQSLCSSPVEDGVQGVLERIVHAARDITGADVVSVTLRDGDGFTTPVETDPVASKADAVQYEFTEGPCVEATLDAGIGYAASGDLGRDTRWLSFGPAAAELGLHAVFATGMFPGEDARPRLGALNYYSRRVGGLDDVDRDTALLLATHAAVALKGAQAVEAAELRASQLKEAVQSRDVIGQAKGILMERRGLSADDAFDTLRRTSQELNIKLRDLAATLASRRADL
ncbi:GAF and ANTAR domain-containing protein [Actinomycetospora sp. OC33-EN08]|uniref:GAF and ANTAR domain-containing protein n=1 Tax=Actinomycetospora aurantiaca TaxID=3129233 RepID=A0ABU8MUS1_9PSEU